MIVTVVNDGSRSPAARYTEDDAFRQPAQAANVSIEPHAVPSVFDPLGFARSIAVNNAQTIMFISGPVTWIDQVVRHIPALADVVKSSRFRPMLVIDPNTGQALWHLDCLTEVERIAVL